MDSTEDRPTVTVEAQVGAARAGGLKRRRRIATALSTTALSTTALLATTAVFTAVDPKIPPFRGD